MTREPLFPPGDTWTEKVRRVFGWESDSVNEDEDECDVVVEQCMRNEEVRFTVERTISRDVRLVHFESGDSLLVEFDDQSGGTFTVVSGVSWSVVDSHGRSHDSTERDAYHLEYDDEVVSCNMNTVTHSEPLGSFDVHVEQDVVVNRQYTELVGVTDTDQEQIEQVVTDNYDIELRVCDTHDRTIHKHRVWSDDDDVIVYKNERYVPERTVGPLRTEPQDDMLSVAGRVLSGGTNELRAITAAGQVVLPNSDVGREWSGDDSDVDRVRAITAGGGDE